MDDSDAIVTPKVMDGKPSRVVSTTLLIALQVFQGNRYLATSRRVQIRTICHHSRPESEISPHSMYER